MTKFQLRRDERAAKPKCQATVYVRGWGAKPGERCQLEATHGKRCWVHSQRSAADDMEVERKTRKLVRA